MPRMLTFLGKDFKVVSITAFFWVGLVIDVVRCRESFLSGNDIEEEMITALSQIFYLPLSSSSFTV